LRHLLSLSIIITLVLGLFHGPLNCFGQITGAVTKNGQQSIKILLKIPGKAPDTAIVSIDAPSGLQINGSNPGFSKISQGKNQAQWLLTGLQTGTKEIIVNFSNDVNPGSLKIVVRYKDAETGKTVEFQIK